MKKSAAILLIIAALVIGVAIGYGSRLDTGNSYEELHEYVR